MTADFLFKKKKCKLEDSRDIALKYWGGREKTWQPRILQAKISLKKKKAFKYIQNAKCAK